MIELQVFMDHYLVRTVLRSACHLMFNGKWTEDVSKRNRTDGFLKIDLTTLKWSDFRLKFSQKSNTN